MVLGIIVVAIVYLAMNLTYVYAMPLTEVAKHETIAACRSRSPVLSACGKLAFGGDRAFLFRRDGKLHALGRARLFRNGP